MIPNNTNTLIGKINFHEKYARFCQTTLLFKISETGTCPGVITLFDSTIDNSGLEINGSPKPTIPLQIDASNTLKKQ